MRKLLLLAAVFGGFFISVLPNATALAVGPDGPIPTHRSIVVTASDPLPKVTKVVRVQAPLPRVTVVSGDTLTAIGARTHRTWQQLAGFNHIPNPNLIYVGDVVTVPPLGYVAPPISLPSAPVYVPPAPRSTPTPVYTPSPAPVVVRAPVSAPAGGFQACVMFRESTNGAGSSNLYGILPSTWASLGLAGSPYSASRAQQDAAFQTLYARDGTSPWSPYDGC
jgi:LysM repeat protein